MWPFKKKNKEIIDISNMPKHIAFIADGNGRWAKKRGLPRSEGHRVGADAVGKVVDRCLELGVEVVSFYLFSTENFKRPKSEVDYIFDLFRKFYKDKAEEYKKKGIRFKLMGDISLFPDDMQQMLKDLENDTKNLKKLICNVGLGYGSRHEIVTAVNKMIAEKIESIDEELFSKYLYTSEIPDPDLIVRASGEQRLSNFMLWQSAYSEFYFPKTHWPDFDAKVVDECIIEYQKRNRRFGKI